MVLETLRQQHPRFVYQAYKYKITSSGLEIEFNFKLEPTLSFAPRVVIGDVTQADLDRVGQTLLEHAVFNLGLVEMLSFWKAACSPEIVIEAGQLSDDQVKFWQKLLINGLGEFFYINGIDFTAPNFVTWRYTPPAHTTPSTQPTIPVVSESNLPKALIPIGGGKDSIVTLQLFKQLYAKHHQSQKLATTRFHLPQGAAQDTIKLAGLPSYTIQHELDPLLLELNERGYLNGHTPFSALFAFAGTLQALLLGYDLIAVSNEESANEGNVIFHNHTINHQYSKSFEFEKDFFEYWHRYINPSSSPHYFSFLRPLYELQIAQLFAVVTETEPEYRRVFRSCNRGWRSNSWCGECSKCLFAYIILFPFIATEEMHTNFGKDLLADESLWPVVLELLAKGEKKPLDCVGTYEESMVAFGLCVAKYHQAGKPLPALLQRFVTEIMPLEGDLPERAEAVLARWHSTHLMPDFLAKYLQTELTSLDSPDKV